MRDLASLIVWAVVDLFRSRAALEAEILTLRQQINVLRRTAPKKQTLIFVCLYRLRPGVRDALAVVKPELLFAGIARVSGCTGAGSRDAMVDGRRYHWKHASSSGK